MPIYEYECTKCGHFEEVFQKISDSPVTECSHCKGPMKKLMSMNSFHLKGSGWYVTDYASKNKSSSAAAGSSAGGTETKKTEKDAGTSSTGDASGTSGKTTTE